MTTPSALKRTTVASADYALSVMANNALMAMIYVKTKYVGKMNAKSRTTLPALLAQIITANLGAVFKEIAILMIVQSFLIQSCQ
jgi:hypothetical protein